MPKFIGRDIPQAQEIAPDQSYVCLRYSQVVKLQDHSCIRKVLDTSDRGGPRSLAKRWYRWYAPIDVILSDPHSTENMRRTAEIAARQLMGVSPWRSSE